MFVLWASTWDTTLSSLLQQKSKRNCWMSQLDDDYEIIWHADKWVHPSWSFCHFQLIHCLHINIVFTLDIRSCCRVIDRVVKIASVSRVNDRAVKIACLSRVTNKAIKIACLSRVTDRIVKIALSSTVTMSSTATSLVHQCYLQSQQLRLQHIPSCTPKRSWLALRDWSRSSI